MDGQLALAASRASVRRMAAEKSFISWSFHLGKEDEIKSALAASRTSVRCMPAEKSFVSMVAPGSAEKKEGHLHKDTNETILCARMGVTWDLVAMSSQTHSGVHEKGIHWTGYEIDRV